MLVFIDDSGDPGFNFSKGSSIYFALAAVIFDCNKSAEETSTAINNLRSSLHWNNDREFKFNKSNIHIRRLFLQTLAHNDFRIRAMLVDKRIITKDGKRAKIQIRIPGDSLIIDRVADTFENAITECVDAMKEKLTRAKEKKYEK